MNETSGATVLAKRRSKRIHIAIPVIVRFENGKAPIEERTRTVRVNAHGCSVRLMAPLETAQRVSLFNSATEEEVVCTVNFLGKKTGEPTEVGLEFAQPSPLFWRIHFPPEGWNPEDRKLPTTAASLSCPLPRR